MNIVFVHGWGMDFKIWDGISSHFSDDKSLCLDLGFIGEMQNTECSDAIYVTHSLGTMWALKHHAPDMKALIVINGFTCFHPFTAERTLRTMQKRLVRNASVQMRSFWSNCGLSEQVQNNLELNLDGVRNTDRLQDGLEWLINWDMADALRMLCVPVLSLNGHEDLVLPHDKMRAHWAGFDLQTHEHGGHILPLSHPDWCVDKIKDFMREHDLEK